MRLTPWILAFVSLLLLALDKIPLYLPLVPPITPSFFFMSLCFWSLRMPEKHSLIQGFLVVIVADLLRGGMFGVYTLGVFCALPFVIFQRKTMTGEGFLPEWSSVALAMGLNMAIQWIGVSFVAGFMITPLPFVFSGVLTVAFYPLVALALTPLEIFLERV